MVPPAEWLKPCPRNHYGIFLSNALTANKLSVTLAINNHMFCLHLLASSEHVMERFLWNAEFESFAGAPSRSTVLRKPKKQTIPHQQGLPSHIGKYWVTEHGYIRRVDNEKKMRDDTKVIRMTSGAAGHTDEGLIFQCRFASSSADKQHIAEICHLPFPPAR